MLLIESETVLVGAPVHAVDVSIENKNMPEPDKTQLAGPLLYVPYLQLNTPTARVIILEFG